MHKLNFCRALCLPKAFEGYECFGMDIIHEFSEAVIVPMARIATPAHVLYVSRPVICHDKKIRMLKTKELGSKEKIDKLLSKKDAEVIAPDHALDLDSRADILFKNRDNSLKQVIEKLFQRGYKKVAVWANNGIGRDVTEESTENGVIRDASGTAVKTRVKGRTEQFYQNKGMPESYQNTAHQHIHIAPISNDMFAFDYALLSSLEGIHEWHEIRTLEQQRKIVRENTVREHLPGISICIADQEYDNLDKPLEFAHYPASSNMLFPQYVMSGLIRTILLNCTKTHSGLDMNDPEIKKEQIYETKKYYQELLNS